MILFQINKPFIKALIANMVWINFSEIFRYFVFIMPMMRGAFPQVEGIAEMNFPIFFVWGVWDMILVFVVCLFTKLYMEYYSYSLKHAILAGFCIWLTVFGLLWLGLFNMGLATLSILTIAWPLSLIEMIVASLIVKYFCASMA